MQAAIFHEPMLPYLEVRTYIAEFEPARGNPGPWNPSGTQRSGENCTKTVFARKGTNLPIGEKLSDWSYFLKKAKEIGSYHLTDLDATSIPKHHHTCQYDISFGTDDE